MKGCELDVLQAYELFPRLSRGCLCTRTIIEPSAAELFLHVLLHRTSSIVREHFCLQNASHSDIRHNENWFNSWRR